MRDSMWCNPAWQTNRAAMRLGWAAMVVSIGASALVAQPRIVLEKNVPAKMRDGVILRADVYRPDTAARLPVLLERTPYSKNPGREDNLFRRLAIRGYVVVVQDTRGRYMSDGVARPHDEAEDGYDTIEWAAALPFSNGRVGTF